MPSTTTTARRIGAGLVLALLALLAPLALPHAEARVVRAPICPATPPTNGDPCPRNGMSCSFPCALPGATDTSCTCNPSDDGRLKWACLAGHVCT